MTSKAPLSLRLRHADDEGQQAPRRHVVNGRARQGHDAQIGPVHPRSVRMRASTGKAVIAMATPRNRAKLVNGTSRLDEPGIEEQGQAAPSRNGSDDAGVRDGHRRVGPVDAAAPAFSSRPTRNMYRMTPSCAMTPRKGATDGGKHEGRRFRPDPAQQRRPEQDAGHDLADDRRLPDVAEQPAQQPACA